MKEIISEQKEEEISIREYFKNIFHKIFTSINCHKSAFIGAKEACLRSTYQEVILSDCTRITNFQISINETIKRKCELGEYHCTRKIPNDLLGYKNQFIEFYRNKGFSCINLKDSIDKKIVSDIEDNILFIYWDNKY